MTHGQTTTPSERLRTLVAVGLGVSIAPLDSSVNVGFPSITAAFGVAVTDIQWVIIGYVLTYSSLMLGCGRLADVIGHRRMMLAGLAFSVLALTLCATATAFEWFLAARFAQGVGSAMVLSVGPALATHAFPAAERTRAVGGFMLAFTASAALGPLIGGALVGAFGWSAVFWYRVPVAIVAAALVLLWVPVPPPRASRERFDVVSALALAVGLAATLLGIARGGHLGWTSPITLGLLATGFGSALFFLRRQGRIDHPVLDPGAFASPAFTAANVAHVLVNGAGFTVMLLVPYYLARAFAGDARTAGALLALAPAGLALAAPIAPRLIARLGSAGLCLAALAICAAGLAGVASWPARAGAPLLAASLLAQGFGQGLFLVAVLDRVMATIPRRHHGAAGSLNMVTRSIGVVCGASGGALMFSSMGGATPERFGIAFAATFWAATAVVVVAAALVGATSRASPRPPPDRGR